MTCSFTPVFYADAPDFFQSALDCSGFPGLPSGTEYALESRYRAAIHGDGFEDLSFCLLDRDLPVACLLAHKLDGACGYNGAGGEVYGPPRDRKLASAILDVFCARAHDAGLEHVLLSDPCSGRTLSAEGMECFNRGGSPLARLRGLIDLTQDEAVIKQGLRKSFKSLISQGRRELVFTYVTGETPDAGLFEEFKKFHIRTAGRQTRSDDSWAVQFEMIRAGCGELILGHLSGYGLVSSALFTDHGDWTSYAVAVYERSLFEQKSLAHANLYEGILRAKARGRKWFNLGVFSATDAISEKEANIIKFKKGFCRDISCFTEWKLSLNLK